MKRNLTIATTLAVVGLLGGTRVAGQQDHPHKCEVVFIGWRKGKHMKTGTEAAPGRRVGAACIDRVIVCFIVAMALTGCASRPINEPIVRADPQSGYRPYLLIPKRQNNDPHTLFVLSFSGGGTRAAALSYGVLEELRRTDVVVDGHRRRMIDEVDVITGVSGGSFTALAYALYGERLFAEYEERFLKRDVQGELMARTLNPFNWWKFIGGSAGRSELAAEYYDEILFEGATFADLLDKPGPVAIATGTDISTGSRLAFFQNDFDLLCSDLNKVRLSRAAATSSAVPVVLSAVTWNNYGGTCGYQYPAWVREVATLTHACGHRDARFSVTAKCRPSRTARTVRISTWWTAASRTTSGCAACWRRSRSSRRARRFGERSDSAAFEGSCCSS